MLLDLSSIAKVIHYWTRKDIATVRFMYILPSRSVPILSKKTQNQLKRDRLAVDTTLSCLILVLGSVSSCGIFLTLAHFGPLMFFHSINNLMRSIEIFRVVLLKAIRMHKIPHSSPRLHYRIVGDISPFFVSALLIFRTHIKTAQNVKRENFY